MCPTWTSFILNCIEFLINYSKNATKTKSANTAQPVILGKTGKDIYRKEQAQCLLFFIQAQSIPLTKSPKGALRSKYQVRRWLGVFSLFSDVKKNGSHWNLKVLKKSCCLSSFDEVQDLNIDWHPDLKVIAATLIPPPSNVCLCRFSAVQKHTVEFNQLAMANSEGSEAMLNRVMTKDNIGVAVLLEVRKEMMEVSCEYTPY